MKETWQPGNYFRAVWMGDKRQMQSIDLMIFFDWTKNPTQQQKTSKSNRGWGYKFIQKSITGCIFPLAFVFISIQDRFVNGFLFNKQYSCKLVINSAWSRETQTRKMLKGWFGWRKCKMENIDLKFDLRKTQRNYNKPL